MSLRLIDCLFIIIIIIITKEKMKVMLSRKRCRGTLQDYNKGEISTIITIIIIIKSTPLWWRYT